MVITSFRLRPDLTPEEWAQLGGLTYHPHTRTRLRNGLINLEMGRLWEMYQLLRTLQRKRPVAFRRLAGIRNNPHSIASRRVILPPEMYPVFCGQWPGPGDWVVCDLTESVLRALLDYDKETGDYVFISPWPEPQ